MRRHGWIALMLLVATTAVAAAEPRVIAIAKAKEVIVTLSSETGQWKPGANSFTIEVTSPSTKQPVDAGKVTLSTSMAMPGMAPMIAGATITPDGPGRYRGTISFPDAGTRQVTVRWDGPVGKGSATLSVAVR